MSILSRVSEALNPRHLAVQWTREGRVSGLLRAILHELPTDSDGTVALEVDGQAMFEAPFRADADGKANLTIRAGCWRSAHWPRAARGWNNGSSAPA